MKRHLLASVAVVAGCFVSIEGAAAQGAPGSAPAPEKNAGIAIEEVVVTAQRREEKIQNVPIAITAVSAAQIEAQGIRDNLGLVMVAPALTINRGAGGVPVTFLRGVGSPNIIAGDEPSIATYIDGFYMGPSTSSGLPYNNIDHVEVLKGPQGTLYGRNATGGLVSIVTLTPRDEFFAKASVGYSTFETLEADGYVTGPIGKKIRADFGVRYRDQNKGYARNFYNGHRFDEDDGLSFRTKIVFDISDNTSLTLGGDYSHTTIGNTITAVPGTVPLATLVGGKFSTEPYTVYNNLDPFYDVKAYGANATLRSDLGAVTFVSMTQFRHHTSENIQDLDGTSADNVAIVIHPTLGKIALPTATTDNKGRMSHFITQEFQLLSNREGRFSWIAGAFGQDSREGYDPFSFILDTTTLAPVSSTTAFSSTKAYAGYAQGTYAFDNGLSLTAGVRYSYEQKHTQGALSAAGVVTASTDKKQSFNAFTYRFSADYRVNEALLTYVSASKGFKSGTFNTATIDAAPAVEPETLYDYEIGFKSDPIPGLRINGGGYYYDYKNIQYYSQSPLTLIVLSNAAAATLYGAELSVEARPTHGLTLTGAVAWEHAEYDSFAKAQVFIPAPVAGQQQIFVNAAGKQLIQTPKITGNFGINYDLELPKESGVLSFAGSVYYNGGYPFDPAGLSSQGAYTTVNGSATWTLPGGLWSVSLWGRNIGDERYYTQLTVAGRGARYGYAQPRTYGITLHYQTP